MNTLNENMRWLHICTNGKMLVSAYYLNENYHPELKDCKRELVEMCATGKKNEYNAVGNGVNYGTFYMQ